eukprot:Selendium_serpulae@DN6199_c0_g1_i1.p1
MTTAEAFPEHTFRVPLTPQNDQDLEFKKYAWGNEPIPMARLFGVRELREPEDNKCHSAVNISLPWPASRRIFVNNERPETDRINSHYSNMISDRIPLGGTTTFTPLGKEPGLSSWVVLATDDK